MPSNVVGSIEWLGDELAHSKLFDRGLVNQILHAFRQESPFGDATALSEYLIKVGLLTPYQARRATEGDARKLVVGPYVILDLIGPGTMGIVYRAMGRADRRNYVVKLLPLRNQWNVRLARRQVEAFEKLPPQDGIVPFIDVGTSHGQHYLVWPFIEGQTLEKFIQEKGAMSTGQIALLGVQIAEALEVCYPRGIVHGFLKPTNIMMGYDGQARLLDFGIGAILAENSNELDSMIDTCATAQTTASMLECAAPELILEPSQLTPITDQYSLGCVLYYAATGRYPFPEGTAMDKVFAHQKRRPAPIEQLNPKIKPEMIIIIDRLMAKVPQDRYRKLRDLIHELAPLAGRASNSLVPPTVPVDVQTPLPAKVFRKRDLEAEKPEVSFSPAIPLPEATIIDPSEFNEDGTPKTQKKRGWFRRLLGG